MNLMSLSRFVILILAVAAFAPAQSQPQPQIQPQIPDTPAGHTLTAWLDAFNSADRAKIDKYVKTIDPSNSVDGMMGFHSHTGGFDLLSIESTEPLHIRFRVKEKNSDTTALGNLTVKDGQPPTVATFGLRALPPGVTPVNVIVDAALRQKVIDGIDADLLEFYIDASLAQKMKDALDAHARAGDYNSLTDGDAFAARLDKDLEDVSHDKHLHVAFSPFKMPPAHPAHPGRRGPLPQTDGTR